MIDTKELCKGMDFNPEDHPIILIEPLENTIALIDEETAELLFFDFLH